MLLEPGVRGRRGVDGARVVERALVPRHAIVLLLHIATQVVLVAPSTLRQALPLAPIPLGQVFPEYIYPINYLYN